MPFKAYVSWRLLWLTGAPKRSTVNTELPLDPTVDVFSVLNSHTKQVRLTQVIFGSCCRAGSSILSARLDQSFGDW